MSIAGYSDQHEKMNKKSFHRRNDSGELDVFEAARYFSGYNEGVGYNSGAALSQKAMKEDRQQGWRGGGGRISLDIPMRGSIQQSINGGHHDQKQMIKDSKKYKQPSSPGGKLASFLNSLFNQTSSRKKKSKSSTTQSMKDHEEESPGGRRKRRSSISHFRISTATNTDTKSLYNSSSSSGFRTPPPYAHTPTKAYKDLRSYSDHKQVISLSKNNGHLRSNALHNQALDDTRSTEFSWLDEKFKFSDISEKLNRNLGNGYSGKDRIWVDQYLTEEKEYKKFNEVDECGDSDSSSDLFELQNYDLGSGLPVYETTNMESIKRGAPPISSGIL